MEVREVRQEFREADVQASSRSTSPEPTSALTNLFLIHRYMVQMAVADYSGQAWLSGFNDVGLTVFSVTADELNDIKVRDVINFFSAIGTY